MENLEFAKIASFIINLIGVLMICLSDPKGFIFNAGFMLMITGGVWLLMLSIITL